MDTSHKLAMANLIIQPLSISCPTFDWPLKLNFGFLQILPKFDAQPSEDLHQHIHEFITCSMMYVEAITHG